MIVQVLVWAGVAVQLVCLLGFMTARSTIDRIHFSSAATTIGPSLIAAAVCF